MPADAKLIRDLFLAAAELPVAERSAYFTAHCGGDSELQAAVERLLAAHEQPASVLLRPAPGIPTANYVPITEKPGTMIGPYKLMEQIGEGGMGLVFVAEQQYPVRRKVALKIIKPGMDTRNVIARFEAERQALAMMDHQNIAKVHDAGATESGRPYFVMELVHGVPITEYCDANKLTPQQRLDLFVPVCNAIQHAHQKGIIHRDIKPSNILVTMYDDKPVPKVIDFGVAKAIEQRLTEKTVYTQFGTLVGTYEYMSPEQAEMNAFGVDTRSDIYSLGVLLYELLTGTTPVERPRLREVAFDEIRRIIKEEEPPRPSVRLSTSGTLANVAAARQTEPAKLSKLVRGELDWVVMRCLEKDRTRRYETANNLARDIQRYLADELVDARPPSAGYRLRKFYRRNRTAVITTTAIVAVALLAVAGQTWNLLRARDAERREFEQRQAAEKELTRAVAAEEQARRNEAEARDQKEEAERNAAEAQALMSFIESLTWTGSNVVFEKSGQRNASFLEALATAEPRIGDQLRDHPLAEAQLRNLLGDLYSENDEKLAVPQYRRALELRRRELGPDHNLTFKAMDSLAWVLEYAWEPSWKDAIEAREECVARQLRLHGPLDPRTLSQRIQLARACFSAGQLDRARATFDAVERNLGVMKARSGMLELSQVECFRELGNAYRHLKETGKAIHWYREAGQVFGTSTERFTNSPQDAVDFVREIAYAFAETKTIPDALNWYERYVDELHAGWKQSNGSPLSAYWLDCGRITGISDRPEDFERVAVVLSRHIEYVRKNQPNSVIEEYPGSKETVLAKSLSELGRCRVKQGRYAEAEAPLRESLEGRRSWNSKFWTTYETWSQLGGSLLGQKKYAEAEKELLAGYSGLKERIYQMPEDAVFPRFSQVINWLVELYTALGKPDEVKKWEAERTKYPEVAPPPREKR